METDRSELAVQFEPYLHDFSVRLEVRSKDDHVRRGYVGKTTGWRPVYILLPRRDSSGSSDVLSHNDVIVRTFKIR